MTITEFGPHHPVADPEDLAGESPWLPDGPAGEVAERRASTFPLSVAQRQLWMAQQRDPASAAFTMPLALRMVGPVDRSALQRALDDLVARHESLRTVYRFTSGSLVQLVLATAPVPLRNWTGSPAEQKELLARPFDLAHGPLVRTWLSAPDTDGASTLLVTMHHLVADGWSVPILIRELTECYAARRRGDRWAEPEPEIQPADIAGWEQQGYATGRFDNDLQFWRSQLRDLPPPIELPGAHRVTGTSGPLAELITTIEPDVAQGIRAPGNGHTRFTLVLAALSRALGRLTGETAVVVGVPYAHRDLNQVARTVGTLMLTLPVRIETDPGTDWNEHIAGVSAALTAATAHPRLPDNAGPIEGGVILTTRDDSQSAPFGDCRNSPIDVQIPHTKTDLSVVLVDSREPAGDNRTTLEWDYRGDRYPSHIIETLADQTHRLLSEAVGPEPPVPPTRATAVAADRRRQLRHPLDLFAEQVRQRAGQIAIQDGDRTLTYAELDRAANRLAHRLRARAVGTETPVGLLLPRGLDLAVAALAVWKCGGHYLALDPTHPRARLDQLLAGVDVVVATSGHGLTGRAVIDIAADQPGLPDTDPGVRAPLDSIATRIHTSGTTGQPKAVGVTLRGVSAFVDPGQHSGFAPERRALWMSAVSFDMTTSELWGTLLRGGTGFVLPAQSFTSAQIGAAVRQYQIDLAIVSTSLFHTLIDENPATFAGLHTVVIGGEPLSGRHVAAARRATPQARYVNGYGPTEITTLSHAWMVPASTPADAPVPIGRLIAGTTAVVVDTAGVPVPDGGVGELWLAGDGLARGYLNDVRRTADRFVPAPGGDRWYRTGDRARADDTGVFHYYGRLDRQLKVRGHRVEPGEVETALRSHPAITEAVVVGVPTITPGHRLVAYVVPADPGALRSVPADLAQELPGYLVPDQLVPIERLPLTAHGKVDIKQLPVPTTDRQSTHQPPRTATERQVCAVVAEVLGASVDEIGADTEFFRVGGTSLNAASLADRLSRRLSRQIPLSVIFADDSVAAIAAATDAAIPAATAPIPAPPVTAAPPLVAAGDTVTATANQRRLWLQHELEPESTAYQIPLLATARGPLDEQAFAAAVTHLQQRHPILRSRFFETESGDLHLRAGDPRTPEHWDLHDHADAPRLVRQWLTRPFDLRAGEPPMRAVVARTGVEHYLVGVCLHHLVADGWSVGVICSELAEAYRAAHHGKQAQACEATIDFLSYAAQQDGADASADLDHWRSLLEGAPVVAELPSALRRPARRTGRAGVTHRVLGPGVLDALDATAARYRCTRYTVMLAAFVDAFAELTDEHDVVVGTPAANRHGSWSHGIVGFLATTLPLRLSVPADREPATLLAQVRERVATALEHPAVQLDAVIDALRLPRDPSRTPLVQLMFAYDNTPKPALELDGVLLNPVQIDPASARFDLTAHVSDGPDRIRMTWEYDADAYTGKDIARFVSAFHDSVFRICGTDQTGNTGTSVALERVTRKPAGEADGDPGRTVSIVRAGQPVVAGRVGDVVVSLEAEPPFRTGLRGHLDESGCLHLRDRPQDRVPTALSRPPQGTAERAIAAAWGQIAGADSDPVSDAHADFFTSGGNSFQAARLAARLRRMFGNHMSTRSVLEHPTVAGLALVAGRTVPTSDTGVAAHEASQNGARMTTEQQRIWLHVKLHPDDPAYNMPLVVQVDGRFDHVAFATALRALAERHDALRARFSDRDGSGFMSVSAEAAVPVQKLEVPSGDREAAVAAITSFCYRPFDLRGGEPPIRAAIAPLTGDSHVVGVVVHHLAADGWSVGLLMRELSAGYRAAREGRSIDLRPAAGSFLQAASNRPPRTADDLQYWKDLFSDAPDPADPVGDRAVDDRSDTPYGYTAPLVLRDALMGSVKARAAQIGGTDFVILLAGWALALSRTGGSRDLVIGTPVGGRDDLASEQTVGLLSGLSAVRVRMLPGMTVADYLRHVGEGCRAAITHGAVELPHNRAGSQSPLIGSVFSLDNTGAPDPELAGATVQRVDVDNPTAKFDSVLHLTGAGDVLSGGCEVDLRLMDAPGARRLADRFVCAVRALCADPDQDIDDIDLIGPQDRDWIQQALPCRREPYDTETPLDELVRRAADRDPDHTAVICADTGREIAYQQLVDAADRVRIAIEALAAPLTPVGIELPRSLDLVIAQLATLGAGRAFVPIDPDWPAARRELVLADAGCDVVIVAAKREGGTGARQLTIDEALNFGGAAAPQARSAAESPAYIVYTSGSTGRPKGVLISHRAIVNNLQWMQWDWPLSSADRLLHKTASTFDVAVKEIFWPLIAGATLVLAEPGSERDPAALVRQLHEHGITITHFVPSMLEPVVGAASRGAGLPASLRIVMSGAEVLAPHTVRRFAEVSDATLLHLYGPTETTVAVTGWSATSGEHRGRLPLGRPLPNCRMFVLDEQLRLVPPGSWGELYIGGKPLAYGYLGRPRESAAAFLPDGSSGLSGQRLYRTGDMVRLNAQGLLEFGGRRDQQVKLRGRRIELGEVEAALMEPPGVAAAVAMVAGEPSRLIGYIMAHDRVALPDPDEVRRHLKRRLPAALVPAQVVPIADLPRTGTGKLDRGRLPPPPALTRPGTATPVAPRDDLERELALLWTAELGIAEVGVEDDFFELGGQSLQAAEIVATCAERFEVDLPVAEFFASPTVTALARMVRMGKTTAPIPGRRRTAVGGPR